MFFAFMLASLALVQDGKPVCSLSIPENASPSMVRGGDELQRHLYEMSGARLLPEGKSKSRCTVALRSTSEYGPEGFSLKTTAQGLTISGGSRRGVMYGVYTLLEKLGCRWYTKDVSRIPKRRTVRIPPLDEVQKPAFELRWPGITEAEDRDWAARNKLNGSGLPLDASTGGRMECNPYGHSFHWLISPAKYFETHPEYFALVEGRRRYKNAQLCLTNPDVIRTGIERLYEWIREHPEVDLIAVCQEDWQGYCECDGCRRVEQEEGGAHSGPILRFVNALAEAVSRKYPEKNLYTFAYQYSEPAPLKTRPHPNVRVQLAPISACVAHPTELCPRNKKLLLDNLKGWGWLTRQIYMYGYATNFAHYLYPFPDFYRLAHDIPMFEREGVAGVYYEGSHQGSGGDGAGMRAWVMSKLMWNTSENLDRLVDDFLGGVYGKGAPAMRAVYDLLHNEVRFDGGGKGKHMWIDHSPWLEPGTVEKARRLYGQALAAAENEAVRLRIRKASFWLDYSDLFTGRRYRLQGDMYVPEDPAGMQARFQAFMKKKKEFGVGLLTYTGRDDTAAFARSLKPFRVLTLENAALRADVVPELSSRVVRLIDKRTGHDLARKPHPAGITFPDAAGIFVAVHPDPGGDGFEAQWSVESQGGGELRLRGVLPNGFVIYRRIALAPNEAVLIMENRLENGGTAARDAQLVARFDTTPEDLNDVADETRPGEVLMSNRRTGVKVRAVFDSGAGHRASVGKDDRHGNRASVVLRTATPHLPPGESLRLDIRYAIEH